ncbi:MAG: YtxH domain-containing protein [bacterium]
MAKQNSVFKALLTGAAIGTAIGVLFAPDSGEKTRKRLRDLSEQAKDTLEQGREDLVTRARNLRSEIEQLTSHAVESGQKRVRDEVDALLEAVEQGRKVLREKHSKKTDAKKEK